ncbi:MAG: serine/threonine-protein kinase, partial [Eubacteriales bacterium]
MSEPKLISPLLDGMVLASHQPMGDQGTVCALRHTTTNQFYILKQLDIPQSSTQVEALMVTGAVADEASAQAYYQKIVEEHIHEFKRWYSLNGSTNLAAFLDYQVEPKEEGVGFHLYLLSHHWHTLSQFLRDNPITWLKALNLGLDLCCALCQLRSIEVVHRNIKPSNIYMDSLGNFMLGDLGLESISSLRYSTMEEHMVSEYTAPEACDVMGELSPTMDIYAVGMVLYRILNSNHGPFEDEETSAKAANTMRIEGSALPAPLYADYELAEIILKACAFHPEDRYQTPEEFQQDLVLYMQRNRVSDQLIVPPIVVDSDILLSPEDHEEVIEPVRFATEEKMDSNFVDNFSPDAQALDNLVKEVHSICQDPIVIPSAPHIADGSPSAPPPVRRKKKRVGMWIAVCASLIALGLLGVFAYFFLWGSAPVTVSNLTVTDKYVDYLTVVAEFDG